MPFPDTPRWLLIVIASVFTLAIGFVSYSVWQLRRTEQTLSRTTHTRLRLRTIDSVERAASARQRAALDTQRRVYETRLAAQARRYETQRHLDATLDATYRRAPVVELPAY